MESINPRGHDGSTQEDFQRFNLRSNFCNIRERTRDFALWNEANWIFFHKDRVDLTPS